MTKAEEMAVLDAAIKKLGRDSYLGPWLQEIRPGLESDLKNDLPPDAVLPSVAVGRGCAIVAQANRDAVQIVTAAKAKADTIIIQAEARRNEITHYAKFRLEEALKRLGA